MSMPYITGRPPRRAGLPTSTSALLALMLLLPACAQATGPALYNPQSVAMSVNLEFANGDEFRNVVDARELKVLTTDAPVKRLRIFLGSGKMLDEGVADTAALSKGIDKPRNQVWVVDGEHICVLDSRKFKRKPGFRCPAAP